jgi:hypothetical protein
MSSGTLLDNYYKQLYQLFGLEKEVDINKSITVHSIINLVSKKNVLQLTDELNSRFPEILGLVESTKFSIKDSEKIRSAYGNILKTSHYIISLLNSNKSDEPDIRKLKKNIEQINLNAQFIVDKFQLYIDVYKAYKDISIGSFMSFEDAFRDVICKPSNQSEII